MPLTEHHKRQLRRLGHARKPIVMVGAQGVRDAVLAEIERALNDHELIKVRIAAGDRAARDEAVTRIVAASGAQAVQRVGHVLLLYRAHPEQPKIPLD